MIILDTNVISALMRPDANPLVVAWLDRQHATHIWTTAVSLMEIRVGLLQMPEGRRRSQLTESFETLLNGVFADRLLPLDAAAAEEASLVSEMRRSRGRVAEYGDYQIAGIARSRSAEVATRNLSDFEGLDIPLIDPWQS